MAARLKSHLSEIRVPQPSDRVYKDECVYSFDTPESPDGLYICMNTFVGLGKNHVERYHKNTGKIVYLHLKRIRKEIKKAENEDSPIRKPTRLAIGLEGGFDMDEKQFEFEETTSIVLMPDWLEILCQDLPLQVSLSVAGIMAADDPLKQEMAAAMAGTWDGEQRVISRFAENLPQLTSKKIPPSGWKCEECDLTSNLWLNLSDGTILCGRKFFDGSGGNNHALDHYVIDRKYPLAVKLGTITEKGGDVFSYEEDDMVEDPHLAKHLLHWGINIAALTKTEKTMAELEIDLNQKIGEWDVIQEAGSALTPLYGPGYTGIRNLGNSCYMNSVMQTLFTLPTFQKCYVDVYGNHFDKATGNPTHDFNVQMAKLGHGIASGNYSKQPEKAAEDKLQPPCGIRPQMFKTLVGRGHPEFSTKRQQDAQEFLLHLVTLIERNSRGVENPANCFKFSVEDRLQCMASKCVRYTKRDEYCLSLPVPMEDAVNIPEVAAYKASVAGSKNIDPAAIVRPRISLMSCLQSFASTKTIQNFYSTGINAKAQAHQISRLATFPDYLFIHLNKFTFGEDWTPKKQDVSIDVPDQLDLSFLRSKGFQSDNEQLLPDEQPSQPAVVIDDSLVNQCMDAGFPFDSCRKAVYHTQSSGLETAMEWLLQHMADPDFTEPLILKPTNNATPAKFVADPAAVDTIMAMGFTSDQAKKALKATDNNVERAADWIFSHMDELDEPMETQDTSQSTNQNTLIDGSEKYTLVGFISHMGTSTLVGHYVCHLLRDDKWVIYNDEKVALSEKPPRDLAYIYLYKRIGI